MVGVCDEAGVIPAVHDLETVVDGLRRCEVSQLPVEHLEPVVGLIRRVEWVTSGLLARVAVRAEELAEVGTGPGSAGLLAGEGEVSPVTARADEARAVAIRFLPQLGSALALGAVGADHVDVVAGVWARASEAERHELASLDADLAEAAGRLTVASFDRKVHRAMARIRERLGTGAAAEAPTSELRWWWGRDNMGRLAGRLTPEQYERLANALGAEMSELVRRAAGLPESAAVGGDTAVGGDAPVGGAAIGADTAGAVALDGRLAAEALINRVTGEGRGRVGRPALTIVVDAATVTGGPHDATMCETESGGSVPREAFERCACDAVVRTVTLDPRGVPVDVGRAQRTATNAQWAALTALYSSCAWHGCDRPIGWCQAHHVVHWDHLGPTDLANLVPLCSRHHHLVHEGGWRLTLHEDRSLEHHRPDGLQWRTSRPDRMADRPGPDAPSHSMSGPAGQNKAHGDTDPLAA